MLARRDTGEKQAVNLDALEQTITATLEDIQRTMFEKAKERLHEKTSQALTIEDIEQILAEENRLIKAMWCGDEACENDIKERTGATSRCIPFEQETISDTCVCCGKPASDMVFWAKAY